MAEGTSGRFQETSNEKEKEEMTQLDPVQEMMFKVWFNALSKRFYIGINPDSPYAEYDLRAAYLAGAIPEYSSHNRRWEFGDHFKVENIEKKETESVKAAVDATLLKGVERVLDKLEPKGDLKEERAGE